MESNLVYQHLGVWFKYYRDLVNLKYQFSFYLKCFGLSTHTHTFSLKR